MKLNKTYDIAKYGDQDMGILFPLSLVEIPYDIKRIFWISNVPKGGIRGGHAHIKCLQTYVCVKGQLKINSNDGYEQDTIILNQGQSVIIPPLLWTEEEFLTGDDVLLVLCSEEYREAEYLHIIDDVLHYSDNTPKVCLLGSGNLTKEIVTFFDNNKFDCCMDLVPKTNSVYNIPNIPISKFKNNFDVGILSVQDPKIKKKIVEGDLRGNSNYQTIIHDTCLVSKQQTNIGVGCVIAPNSLISCNVTISNYVTIDRGCQIGHDSSIGEFSTLAPDVTVSGNVKIGKNAYVGSKTSFKDNITVCDDVIVGMGSVVINDINEPGTYVGVPVKKIK